jgi:hypothetical protein
LLLVVHLAAIVGLLRLQAVRERPGEGMVTLLLSALPKPTAATPSPMPRPRPVPRPAPTLATIPSPIEDPGHSIHDSAQPVAAAAAADGVASAAAPASSAPLNLAIPKEFFTHPPPLTVAQEAMLDPRSNRLVLTRQEKMDVDFGVVECIAWQRQPDGSIYRGPGRYQRIQGVSTNPFTSHKPGTEDRGMECVK